MTKTYDRAADVALAEIENATAALFAATDWMYDRDGLRADGKRTLDRVNDIHALVGLGTVSGALVKALRSLTNGESVLPESRLNLTVSLAEVGCYAEPLSEVLAAVLSVYRVSVAASAGQVSGKAGEIAEKAGVLAERLHGIQERAWMIRRYRLDLVNGGFGGLRQRFHFGVLCDGLDELDLDELDGVEAPAMAA